MPTIDHLIIDRCRQTGDQTALRQKIAGVWQETSYQTLLDDLRQLAAGLRKHGLKPGDRCALLAASSPWWVAAHLGTLHAGGVVVPVDRELKAAELRHILFDSEASVLFTEDRYLETVLELLPNLPALQRIVLLRRGPVEGEEAAALNDQLAVLSTAWRRLVDKHALPAGETGPLEELARTAYRTLTAMAAESAPDERGRDFLSEARSLRDKWRKSGRLTTLSEFCYGDRPPPSPRRPEDLAVILYTSGTTGQAKGAMLSHANITSNISAACRHLRLSGPVSTLSFLPINHVFEQVCGILLPLSLGGTVSFAESLKKLGENLAEVQPSFFLGVPAVYRMILDRIRRNVASKPLSRWLFALPLTRPLIAGKVRRRVGAETIFISGGAALDPAVADGFRALGLRLFQGYGITETAPVVAAEHPGCLRPGTVGCPLEGVQVHIDAPNEDGVGEILVKGPNVMLGYFNNPRATRAALQDGWYRTGDLGRVDADGLLAICGRVKNLIVTPNGKNVYPEEVENELLHSPFIAEAMVYGHKVSATAEEVHAVIYPDQQALDDYRRENKLPPLNQPEVEEVIRREVLAASQRLADYKRIRKFTLRDEEFPKTTTRKIKRFAVEAEVPTQQ